MVFNATFNNISVILWRSVLLVEGTILIAVYYIVFTNVNDDGIRNRYSMFSNKIYSRISLARPQKDCQNVFELSDVRATVISDRKKIWF